MSTSDNDSDLSEDGISMKIDSAPASKDYNVGLHLELILSSSLSFTDSTLLLRDPSN